MSKKQVMAIGTAAILIGMVTHCALGTGEAPEGWSQAGKNITDYEVGVDKQVNRDGKNCAYIKSIVPSPKEYTTLMQETKADVKRVRLSVFIKAEDVKGWAGLWMRADGNNDKTLAFDNTQDRPIKGTSDWKKYEIVLDVPEESIMIYYGVLLEGKGKIWMGDLQVEMVDKDVSASDNETVLGMSTNDITGSKTSRSSSRSSSRRGH